MFKTFTSLLLATLLTVLSVKAQDSTLTIGRVSIASPTAASLGQYGDIPVSYHTGIPDISIPLYAIASKNLKMPVTLSYHSGGIKPAEISSWVGAGWALSAGGVITRTVNGSPDDKGSGGANYFQSGYYSDYGYHGPLWIYQPGTTTDGYVSDDKQFVAGRKDGQPDMYSVNFGGKSYKCYFGDDRKVHWIPNMDLPIEPDYVEGQGFRGFIITANDGSKLYFGKTGNNGSVDPIEITIPSTLQFAYAGANSAVSSWYLNKVVSFDKTDSITFEYATENYSYHNIATMPLSSAFVPSFLAAANIEYYLVKNFVKGVRLTKINYSAGSILFTPAANPRTDLSAGWLADGSMYDTVNTESRALGSITFKNNSGTVCKKDSFYYGYWSDNSALTGTLITTYNNLNLHSDRYRLRLDSMKEMSCDGSIKIPAHQFEYFGETVYRRLTFGIDFWGYANGRTSNTRLQPTVYSEATARFTIQGADRDPRWPAMRGAGLRKITYPTGGSTEMVFEPHDTYVSKDTFSVATWTSRSVGFYQYVARDTFTANLAGNYMTFYFSSSAGGGEAHVNIYNDHWGGSLAYSFGSIQPNVIKEGGFTLPAGKYCFELIKQDNASGIGAAYNLYEWTPHHIDTNAIVGGYRIKQKITRDKFQNAPNITNYVYRVTKDTNTMSSGILYTKLDFIRVIRNDVYGQVWGMQGNCSPNGCASCDGQAEHTYYTSGATIRPMEQSQGSHIGYNDVFVIQPGNGYSNYRYYGKEYGEYVMDDICTRRISHSPLCDTKITNYPDAPPQFDPKRGELKFEGHYDQNGTIVSSKWYYPLFVPEAVTTPGLISTSIGNLQTHTIYEIWSFKKLRDSVDETIYMPSMQQKRSDDNYISSTASSATYYNSVFHYQATDKLSLSSTGLRTQLRIQYAQDFPTPQCVYSPDSTGYYLGKMAQDSGSFKNAMVICGSDGSCRYGKYQQWRRTLSLDRLRLMNYMVKYYSDTARQSCFESVKAVSNAESKAVMQLQLDKRYAPIEVSKYRNNQTIESGFNVYQYFGNYVYQRLTRSLHVHAPVNNFYQAISTIGNIPYDDRYAPETYLVFKQGNVTTINPRRGTPMAYIYDYGYTVPVAEVTGTEDSAVAYTSFEADGTGSWVVAASSRDTSSAITGKISYNLSSGNITRSNLVDSTSYYVSYWTKNTTPLTITGTQGATHKGKTINGWTCFQHLVTGVTSVTLSGSGLIDEVRLFPRWANMQTYTYDLGAGKTSICDQRNRITYYTYDILGRLIMTKDEDGNILQTMSYKYQEEQQ